MCVFFTVSLADSFSLTKKVAGVSMRFRPLQPFEITNLRCIQVPSILITTFPLYLKAPWNLRLALPTANGSSRGRRADEQEVIYKLVVNKRKNLKLFPNLSLQLTTGRPMSSKPRVKWTLEMEGKLVELWQENECLFDVSSKEFHIREEKEKRWAAIAAALGRPGRGSATGITCLFVILMLFLLCENVHSLT